MADGTVELDLALSETWSRKINLWCGVVTQPNSPFSFDLLTQTLPCSSTNIEKCTPPDVYLISGSPQIFLQQKEIHQ